jgi:hypothetical protein
LGKGSSESPNSTTAPSPKEADAASLCGSMIIQPLNPIYHHTAKEAFLFLFFLFRTRFRNEKYGNLRNRYSSFTLEKYLFFNFLID